MKNVGEIKHFKKMFLKRGWGINSQPMGQLLQKYLLNMIKLIQEIHILNSVMPFETITCLDLWKILKLKLQLPQSPEDAFKIEMKYID